MRALSLTLLISIALPLTSGCEYFQHGEGRDKARTLIEACLREANVQGEHPGKLGTACQALNDWVRSQGWSAQ